MCSIVVLNLPSIISILLPYSMNKNLFVLTLFALLSMGCFAQKNVIIFSKIKTVNNSCDTDSTEKTILLEKKLDESFILVKKFTSTKCRDYFSFERSSGEFRFTVNAENYQPVFKNFSINASSKDTLLFDELVLKKQSAITLAEVTIVGVKREYIKIDADKTTVFVKNNELLSEGSMYDAIGKLPGVLSTPNGNLILNGKQTAIWIDGQPSSLTGQDLVNFLNNLPANVVEKIEIISNPGAAYDANTSGGIINIITTGKTLKGLSGTLNTYFGRSVYNKLGTSLILNGKVKNVGWQVSTGYSENNFSEEKNMKINFNDYNPAIKLNQHYFSINKSNPFFIRTSVDYALNKNSTIGLKYNVNSNKNRSPTNGNILGDNAANGLVFNSLSKPTEINAQHELIVSYRQLLDTSGSILNVSTNLLFFDKNNLNAVAQSTGSSASTNTYSISKNEQIIKNNFYKADLTIPYKKINLTFNMGMKLSFSKVNSNGAYNFNNASNTVFTNPIYSDQLQFKYHQSNYAFYITAGKKIKKLQLNGGLRYEYYNINSSIADNTANYNQHFSNVFPSANLLYPITEGVNFSASYTRKINQPGYSELDPNLSGNFDSYSQVRGNPTLKPNYYNNFETKLSIFEYAYLGFSYSNSKSENLLVIENSGNLKALQTYKTFNGLKNYDVSLGVPLPYALITQGAQFFKQPINIEKLSFLYLIAGYNFYKINNAAEYITQFKPYYYLNIFTQIVLPLKLKLGLNYSYVTKGTYQVYQINSPIHDVEIMLSKTFFNQSLKATFIAKDVLKTFKTNAIAQANNIKVDYSLLNDTQSFRVGISYNFGKFSTNHKQQETEQPDELKRIDKRGEIGPKKE